MAKKRSTMESLAINNLSKEFWQDRNVLITGATGLLGSWTTKYLLKLNASVVAIIRDWVPGSIIVQNELFNKINVVRGDICNQQLLERVLGEYEIETVLHLAAQTIVPIANRNPISTFETNIAGTWKLLEACRRSPAVKQIVVASSDKAYGQVKKLPYVETTPLNGSFPYDVSKSCTDLITKCYANTWNTPAVITRCGNFFGGGDLNWNRIVPGTIRSVIRGESPVIRSNGTSLRDYIYIEDAVIFYLLLAEKLSSNLSLAGEAFNFSNEQPLSVQKIVDYILELMDTNLKAKILNEADHEINHQYLDSSKARTMLNWNNAFTIKDGLTKTIDWYKQYLKGS